jgi:hypothetical protein
MHIMYYIAPSEAACYSLEALSYTYMKVEAYISQIVGLSINYVYRKRCITVIVLQTKWMQT